MNYKKGGSLIIQDHLFYYSNIKQYQTMRSKILFLMMLCSSIAASLSAQSAYDMYRLSSDNLLGTARSLGTNTHMSAIGGDFISVSSNPAGLAQFSFSEIMLTAGMGFDNTESLLQGANNIGYDGSKARFKVPNIGLVIASPRRVGQDNKFVFGIGYNSSLAYNKDYNWTGSSTGSISDRFAALANGLQPSQLDNYEGGLAYDTYVLIDQNPDGSWNYDYKDFPHVALQKEQIVSIKSVNSELAVSGGLRAGDMILAGLTIGVPFNSYTEHRNYLERDATDGVPFFEALRFRDYKKSTGVGINAKAGLIFKPVNALSVGVAVHTPTLLSQKEDYDTRLAYTYQSTQGGVTLDTLSPLGTINYRITTPLKLIGSIGTVIAKTAFLNAEVGWTDYSSGKVKVVSNESFDKETERLVNTDIKNIYTSALRINLGGEFAFKGGFRLRAGYGMAQSGLATDDNFYPSYAAGLGYRKDRFYVDLAYKQFSSEAVTAPYLISGDAPKTLVDQSYKNGIFLATFGLKLF